MILTWLFVPASRPDRFAKALASGADAIVVDLEDAVAAAAKNSARDRVASWLGEQNGAGPEIWVRPNTGDLGAADLDALLASGGPLTGLMLAKAELASTSRIAAQLSGSGIALAPLLETAGGILEAEQLAALPGVRCLHLGEYDLAAELGLQPGPDDAELAPFRARVVLASAASDLEPPPAAVSTLVRDLAAFGESTRRVRRQGFLGRVCVHPDQLAVVREVFTPTTDERRRAQEVIDALDAAGESSSAVAVTDDGRMVDEAVLRSARRVLALAARA